MRRFLLALALGAATAACGAPPAPAPASTSPAPQAFQGAELAPEAHLTIDQARTAALAVRAGSIADQELERESGGSGLRYSFDVVQAGTTYEVGIDAQTGAVLENAPEGPNPD